MGSKVCGVVSRHPRLVDMGIACSGVLARMEQDQTCQVVPSGCAQHVSCVLHFAFAKIYLCTLPCVWLEVCCCGMSTLCIMRSSPFSDKSHFLTKSFCGRSVRVCALHYFCEGSRECIKQLVW